MIDYRNGIHAVDSGYVRPMLMAQHLIVDDGRAAFVDTGSNACMPRAIDALGMLGLARESVDYVILTHIHLDHAGAAGAMMREFPNARLVVHPRGVRHMVDPTRLMEATEAVYGRETARTLYGELVPIAAGRVIEANDGLALLLGGRELVCYDAPGHAKHHIFIHDRAANGIFSGDAFGICYRELDVDGRHFLFPTTSPAQFDPVAMRASVERMIGLHPEAIYLTHFSRVAPPCELAVDLLRRLDECVAIARRIPAGSEAAAAIQAALTQYLLREARDQGVSLPDAEILDLWATDLELDAQGLAIWAASEGS